MAEFNLRKLDAIEFTITVKATKEFQFRVWLATKIFVLGARVLGAAPKIEYEDG